MNADTIKAKVREMFGACEAEANAYVKTPEEDKGEWAKGHDNAVAVIYLEPDFRFPEDQGKIPDALGYWSSNGFDNCIRLGVATGTTVEYYNSAVAIVYK